MADLLLLESEGLSEDGKGKGKGEGKRGRGKGDKGTRGKERISGGERHRKRQIVVIHRIYLCTCNLFYVVHTLI